MTDMKRVPAVEVSEGKLVKKGSIKKKIESFRRWSSASMKRPPKPKAKTLSLSSPVGEPDDLWLQEGDRRKLRPIVDSVFGQGPTERSGTPLAAAMLGGLGGPEEVDTEDEEEGGSEREFEEPLCALVKNCNMLHNIVGPACIFLRQGFAQSQLVCIHTHNYTVEVEVTLRKLLMNLAIHPSLWCPNVRNGRSSQLLPSPPVTSSVFRPLISPTYLHITCAQLY